MHEQLTKRFVDCRFPVLMRRLRENTMLEAEISPSGTVIVEGHHVGELQGFRFTAYKSSGGEDIKAVRTKVQKALASEFDSRAEHFSTSPNGNIALGSDGVLRWIGAPIGMLVEGEDALKPRIVLLANEQLAGPARDKVAARANRFVSFQVESLLKPLVDLKAAEQLSESGRGIAFQLVKNFGLINRRDIAEEVNSLDQKGRAALRRLGVRFGAYHVFVPALIKPAPASLITLLWAIKNDGKDKPGFGAVFHALAAGRTSVVIDPTFEKTFSKLAGFRNLGRRAVRLDILERLADLIRPTLAWKQGVGARPDGAYDGNAFIVTPQMMSILGATSNDMEEILKGLGYRAEPKPAAEIKEKLEAIDRASREAVVKAQTDKAAIAEAAANSEEVSARPFVETAETTEQIASNVAEQAHEIKQAEQTPEVTVEQVEAFTETAAEAETGPVVEAQSEAASELGVMTAAAKAPAVNSVSVEAAAANAPEATDEPRPILLWRQGRFEQRSRHRQDARARDGQRKPHSPDAAGASTSRQGKATRNREGDEGGPDNGRPRLDRKLNGKPQGENGRPDNRSRGKRPVRIDLDSPFAKLAALREQLKK